MIIEDGLIMELQDNILEVHKHFQALCDIVNVLQYGFESVTDENNSFVVSSLWVIEEQLRMINSKMEIGVNIMDRIKHSNEDV
ncbi:hypothetical protein LK537_16355 [Lachnoclostridium pacaense]|uniref:hypothetical protein n=1 Tax=Enterocloster hominis (ex Hitch et al. 2024) TaxID=1917870 RepID=UPI001D106192|nr:hypothetical protein [Lachnoclostridium pacaense]MCC2818873.1 hypothetical protein [Lachnoclostridium pacaense]